MDATGTVLAGIVWVPWECVVTNAMLTTDIRIIEFNRSATAQKAGRQLQIRRTRVGILIEILHFTF